MYWLLVIIFIISNFPSFQLIDSQSFLNTHNLTRLLTLLVFIIYFPTVIKQRGIFIKLILFFIFASSLSLINAMSVESFISVFKDIIIASMFSICIYAVVSRKLLNNIFYTIAFFITFSLLYELLYLFFPGFNDFIRLFLYNKTFIFSTFQETRGKFFESSYIELFFPVLLLLLTKSKINKEKIIIIALICIQFFVAIISGWRIKVAILGVSLFFFYIYYLITHISLLRKTLFTGGLILFIFYFLYSQRFFYASKTRFAPGLNPLEIEDTSSLYNRMNMWQEALNIGLSYPITGVGLGNYYDYSGASDQKLKQSNAIIRENNFIRIQDPHNVLLSYFSMTGIVGLVSICLIFLLSSFKLIPIILSKSIELYTIYLCFINIFIFGLLNPTTSFGYYIVLFFCIALLHKLVPEHSLE